tara:strand:+ start:768 stop:1367 length:600 start_codon:yes stop_codon:yes gene_type:complete
VIFSNIICEHPLPLKGVISEEEESDFKGIQWDELVFETSSFFNPDEEFERISYLISEDGFFYEHKFKIELTKDEKGKFLNKEVDAGLSREDFTGRIVFGSRIFGKEYDYEMIFEALFYKGELKELNLDDWIKTDNSKRKEAANILHRRIEKEKSKRRKPYYLFVNALKFTVSSLIAIPKWVLVKKLTLIFQLEIWANNR